jgi:hypothetical protein
VFVGEGDAMTVRVVPGRLMAAPYRRPTAMALLAPLAVLLLAGCGGGGGGDDQGKGPAQRSPTPERSRSSSPAAPRPSSSPATGTPSPSGTGALPAAADGTHLGACADARCEVEVAAGSTLRPPSSYGIERFTVKQIKDGTITWTAVFHGGSMVQSQGFRGSDVNCTNNDCYGDVRGSGGTLRLNDLDVTFTAVGQDRAVVRVKPHN